VVSSLAIPNTGIAKLMEFVSFYVVAKSRSAQFCIEPNRGWPGVARIGSQQLLMGRLAAASELQVIRFPKSVRVTDRLHDTGKHQHRPRAHGVIICADAFGS
jgi:hypothetical protein